MASSGYCKDYQWLIKVRWDWSYTFWYLEYQNSELIFGTNIFRNSRLQTFFKMVSEKPPDKIPRKGRAYFSHLLRALSARNSRSVEQNTLFSTKNSKNTCCLVGSINKKVQCWSRLALHELMSSFVSISFKFYIFFQLRKCFWILLILAFGRALLYDVLAFLVSLNSF